MRGLKSWKVATIRGVDLKIHISLLFILVYVILIASAQFGLVVEAAGLSEKAIAGGPLVWGTVFAVALFASVTLHEFGHVFMAQSLGIKVQGITLMMLGGMSEMERMPEQRLQEFKISVVGPLVSFALAGILFLIHANVTNPEVSLFSYWLGRVNLVLGIFNMIPAFPMDGGRALRSLIAARTGMLRATQTAVRVGKVFAWVFGILGFLQFNILLMLIAFFLYSAASSELMLLVTKEVLTGTRAEELGVRVDPVYDRDTLTYAAEHMIRSRSMLLPVSTATGEPAVVGIDALRRIPRERWAMTPVREVMEKTGRALDVKESVADAIHDFTRTMHGALPMMEGGRVVGVVRYSDLTRMMELKNVEKEAA